MVEVSSWEVLGWLLVFGLVVYMIRWLSVPGREIIGSEVFRTGRETFGEFASSMRTTVEDQLQQLKGKRWVTLQDFQPLARRLDDLETRLASFDNAFLDYRDRLNKIEERIKALEDTKRKT